MQSASFLDKTVAVANRGHWGRLEEQCAYTSKPSRLSNSCGQTGSI